MTQHEIEQFLSDYNLPLRDEPIEGKTHCCYRITCPLDQQVLGLIWNQDGTVKAQCLNDFCQINHHKDDSFAFLKSLLHADVEKSASTVPAAQLNDRDTLGTEERDSAVPEDGHDSDSSVPGEHDVSDSPVPASETVPRDAAVPAKDQVITDLLPHFLARATEHQKDALLYVLRHGDSPSGMQRFIEDCFVRVFGSKIAEQEVYCLYESWCITHAQYTHTKTDLYQFLAQQGYRRTKSNGKKYW